MNLKLIANIYYIIITNWEQFIERIPHSDFSENLKNIIFKNNSYSVKGTLMFNTFLFGNEMLRICMK